MPLTPQVERRHLNWPVAKFIENEFKLSLVGLGLQYGHSLNFSSPLRSRVWACTCLAKRNASCSLNSYTPTPPLHSGRTSTIPHPCQSIPPLVPVQRPLFLVFPKVSHSGNPEKCTFPENCWAGILCCSLTALCKPHNFLQLLQAPPP